MANPARFLYRSTLASAAAWTVVWLVPSLTGSWRVGALDVLWTAMASFAGATCLGAARERIERSGGTLSARSVAGEGTTLCFELPFGQVRPASLEFGLVTV